MRIVVALGGRALQRKGEPMTVEGQRAHVATAAEALAPVALEHDLVVSHGHGPQVGLLAQQAAAHDEASAYSFDVLGAQTEGMIGYLIEQELSNLRPSDTSLATVLTMTEVDPADPAFAHPTTFVGPVYTAEVAEQLAASRGWTLRQDGSAWRRVVSSPEPRRIFETRPVEWLLTHGCVVICAVGGGIPTTYADGTRRLAGVEAVIDEDRAGAVLAADLHADLLVIATDVEGVYLDWGTPKQRVVEIAHPDALDPGLFPTGSMGPKVEAAAQFARRTGRSSVIGSLDQLPAMIDGDGGTRISTQADGLVTR
jgi:carbamate kinase